jgi:hypothetical protein
MIGFWAGCSAPHREFDLDSYHSSIDQRFIARFYHEEALRYRQQADEADTRAEMYERMFGSGSDWVSGARLLAQSYRLAADDRERLANEHLQAGGIAKPSATSLRPQAAERTP